MAAYRVYFRLSDCFLFMLYLPVAIGVIAGLFYIPVFISFQIDNLVGHSSLEQLVVDTARPIFGQRVSTMLLLLVNSLPICLFAASYLSILQFTRIPYAKLLAWTILFGLLFMQVANRVIDASIMGLLHVSIILIAVDVLRSLFIGAVIYFTGTESAQIALRTRCLTFRRVSAALGLWFDLFFICLSIAIAVLGWTMIRVAAS